MDFGPGLDALVAYHVFGEEKPERRDHYGGSAWIATGWEMVAGKTTCLFLPCPFSTEWKYAGRVVQEMDRNMEFFVLQGPGSWDTGNPAFVQYDCWTAFFGGDVRHEASGTAAPHAICLAALAAKGVKLEDD